jgi:hypothetical protein
MLGKQAPQSLALGQLGSLFIDDTDSHTGQWGILYCVASCTFTTLTSGNLPSVPPAKCMVGTLEGIALSAGMHIAGFFTTVKLATGKVIAYNI